MNILADESVDQPIVDRLRQDGHQVLFIAELEPSISDEAVLALANQHTSVLLTADRDFGDLIFRQRRDAAGVILIRLAGLLPATIAMMVSTVVCTHATELLTELLNAFTVVSPVLLVSNFFLGVLAHIPISHH
jgi:predicted nuclease of predicted toxin-antitoxin system